MAQAKEIKGQEQLSVVRDAVYVTLEQPSPSKHIFAACQKDPRFSEVFDKHAFARVRTILQRNCKDAVMYNDARYRDDDIFWFDKSTKLWGRASARPREAAVGGAAPRYATADETAPQHLLAALTWEASVKAQVEALEDADDGRENGEVHTMA